MWNKSLRTWLLVLVGVAWADAAGAKELHSLRYDWAECVAFSPDGKLLAMSVGSNNKALRVIFDLEQGKERLRLPGTRDAAVPAFSPDGKLLAASSASMPRRWDIDLWDLSTGQSKLQLSSRAPPCSIAFAPDGRTLLVGYREDAARLWDLSDGKELRSWKLSDAKTNAQVSVEFSRDGSRLAIATAWASKNCLQLWDTSEWKQVAALDAGYVDRVLFGVDALHFFPDGKRLAVAAGGKVTLWDLQKQKPLAVCAKEDNLDGMALSKDGLFLATTGSDGGVNLWAVDRRQRLDTLDKQNDYQSIAVAPDGRNVAAAREEGIVKIWDVSRFRPKGQKRP